MSHVATTKAQAIKAAKEAGVSVRAQKDGSIRVGSSLVHYDPAKGGKGCWQVDGVVTGYVGEAILAAVKENTAV